MGAPGGGRVPPVPQTGPLTICLQRPLDVNHRDAVSILGAGHTHLNLDIFWGRGGQVSRLDPAVIQAGTWWSGMQTSEMPWPARFWRNCKERKRASKMPSCSSGPKSRTLTSWGPQPQPLEGLSVAILPFLMLVRGHRKALEPKGDPRGEHRVHGWVVRWSGAWRWGPRKSGALIRAA